MGILKDKLNKLIGKKNPINSIPAVLGDLLGDIVDSVENNSGNNNDNNGNYHIEIDSLDNITKVPVNDILIKYLAEVHNDSVENIIAMLEETCEQIGAENIQQAAYFMFIIGFSIGAEIYKHPFKIKINKINQLFAGNYNVNDIIELRNAHNNYVLYGNLNIKDVYVAIVFDTNDCSNMYVVHNLEYETGVMLKPNLAGYEDYFSIINAFNYFLNYKQVNYYSRTGSNGIFSYFRILGTNYFYDSNLNRYMELNLDTWNLVSTNWTLP